MQTKIKEFIHDIMAAALLHDDATAKHLEDKISILLSELNEQYSLALKAANMATWKWNYKENILTWDEKMFELYDVDKSTNLQYFNWKKSVHPDDIEEIEKHLFYCVSNHQPFHTSFRIICKDSSTKYIRASGRVFGDCIIGINYDITVNIEKEKALRENLEKQKILFNQSPVGIGIVDTDFKILEINEKFSEIIKWPKNEILNKTFMEITHPDDIQKDVDKANQMLMGKISQYEMEKRYIGKNGEITWVILNAKAIRDENNNISYFIPTITDISYNKQMEIELKKNIEQSIEANKAKSEFLAMMSHEIRTPMNGIMGMAQLLKETNISLEQKKYIDNIQESGEILLHIIGNVLDLSKIESGKIDIYETTFNIKEVFEYIQDIYKSKLNKHINIIIDSDNNIPDILIGDEYKFKQILFNLVGNACKFTKDGTIKMHSKLLNISNEYVEVQISVHDTGEGISQKDISKILEPFAQGDSFSKRRHEGVGLGLTICHKLLSIFGSELKITSKLNEGSEFTFNLKMKIPTSFEIKNNKEIISGNLNIHANEYSILVAEDNKMSQEVIAGFFDFLGINNYTIVSNGLKVVEYLKNNYYDIIFLDIQMPEMDGIETAKYINANFSKEKKPFIYALTAHAMIEDENNFLSNGMDGYLSKPLTLDNLKFKLNAGYQALKVRRQNAN